MRILNNKEIRKLVVISILIILISAVAIIILTNFQNNRYKQIVNDKIAIMLEEIKQKYPKVEDENLIKILNNKENSTIKNNILKKYGINENDLSIYQLSYQERNIIIGNILIIVLTGALLILVFYLYLRYRQRQLDKLAEYLEKVSNKNYILNIKENSEDELNKLKNELYKIAVVLKEEAENSKKQNEILADSVSDISHQLKTPLTSILILLDNLSQNENMDSETRKRFISEIARQIEGMNWLVIVLLKLSRLDAGVVEFTNIKVNANELVKEIVSNLEIMAELRNVTFEIISNKNCYFNGDYNWNKEAIQNIVKNAIEHTNNNTTVTIKIEENDVYTSISITDKGNGINKKDIKHIFERFYKSENSQENSFGIGLSLSKSIIEKQNGYIEVDSKENEGTTFKIKYIKN